MPMNTYNCAFEGEVDAEFDWNSAFQWVSDHHGSAAENFALAEAEGSDETILVRNKETGEIHRYCVELIYSTYEITKLNQE